MRNNVVEDVALARRMKAAGLRLRMVDGNGLVNCRMYTNWPQVRDGFAKNILAGHGNSILFLLTSTLFHWLLFIFPWLWLLVTWRQWALLLGITGVGIRMATAVFTRQRPLDAFLMPFSALLMTYIAIQSIWWRWRGKSEWKGRRLVSG